MSGRRAFTLVELLVSISIVMVLSTMVLVGVTQVRKVQRKASTQKMLMGLGNAVTLYMEQAPELPADFADNHMAYLLHNQEAAGKQALYDPSGGNIVRQASPGQWGPAQVATCEALTDFFAPGSDGGRLRWTIYQPDSVNGEAYPHTIVIRSLAGTPEPDNDILVIYTVDPAYVRNNIATLVPAGEPQYTLDGFDLRALSERNWLYVEHD